MACAACGNAFDDASDIVICPECGAPHHRECWKTAGQCACADRHGAGYEWQPARVTIGVSSAISSSIPTADKSREERVPCPVCGHETPKSQKYCERCGYYLMHSNENAYDSDEPVEWQELFGFDNGDLIDGVPAGDIKRFVGNMWIYYMPRFMKMSQKEGSLTFNFTAFLMHGLWFISRKMYAVGLPLMLFSAFAACYRVYFYDVLKGLEGDRLLISTGIYFLLSGVEFAIMTLSGIFGNKLYMRFCSRRVKQINRKATRLRQNATKFNEALEAAGGVATLPAISIGLCYLALLYALERGLLF